MSSHYATYSPEDDKIRLYLSYRLSAEDYAPIKAAGYHSAPKQGFVFAYWSPKAEDIALELCGDIEDEDKSLQERAAERAERFEGYSDNRAKEAKQMHAAVSAITDNIPLGQPILVGHHSERHARHDAEKIENGMRKAIKAWKTSEYWTNRAADAIAHAKYKERPDVRARRIKTLEAELARCVASYTPLVTKKRPEPSYTMARRYSAGPEEAAVQHVWVGPAGRGGHWMPVEDLPKIKAAYARTEEHLMHRLEYEYAMLGEKIGAESFSTKYDYAIGGQVLSKQGFRGAVWLTILKLNKKDGQVLSVSTNNKHWPRVLKVEDIADYKPPEPGMEEQVKAATKRPPLCNYPGEHFATCTKAQWAKISNDYKSTVHVIEATETTARHCVRWAIGVYLDLSFVPVTESHERCSANRTHSYYPVFITDDKRKDPPTLNDTPPAPTVPPIEYDEAAIQRQHERRQASNQQREADKIAAAPFEQMAEALKTGVQVVTAPQLFPTPKDLARRVVELADTSHASRVLEPSAGTGALCDALIDNWLGLDCGGKITAVEAHPAVFQALRGSRDRRLYANDGNFKVLQADFLECTPAELGQFDRVVMNPPFDNASDIKHVKHAMTFLKPGGRLVAICANGPRQQEKLAPLGVWEPLPAGTFEEAGTMVSTALFVYDAPAVSSGWGEDGVYDGFQEDNPEVETV